MKLKKQQHFSNKKVFKSLYQFLHQVNDNSLMVIYVWQTNPVHNYSESPTNAVGHSTKLCNQGECSLNATQIKFWH